MDISSIDVLILCGGLGTRLRSVTGCHPKSLAKVGTQPFLDILIEYLYQFGFRRFILGVGYKAEHIKRHYLRLKYPDMHIVFSEEKMPLGTGGAVKNAKQLIRSDDFLVLNGDSFVEFDAIRLLLFHQKKDAIITILVRQNADHADYGNIKLGLDSRLTSFVEKKNQTGKTYINAGVYVFKKEMFRAMPRKKKFSLEKEVFPRLVVAGSVFGLRTKGYFVDIGTPERYADANVAIFKSKLFNGQKRDTHT
jgi:NDP-sugar pyrophosphorylase family protein